MNKRLWLKDLRRLWDGVANLALASRGIASSIDHRSLADRGVLRKATLHLGPPCPSGAMAAARRRRERINREIVSESSSRTSGRPLSHEFNAQRTVARAIEEIEPIGRAWSLDTPEFAEIQEMLREHPLFGERPQHPSALSAIIVETWPEHALRFFHYRQNGEKRALFRDACGPGWVFVDTSCGYWALNEVTGAVVKLGCFYICTDAQEESVARLLVKVARTMDVERPRIRVFNAHIQHSLVDSIDANCLPWEVECMKPAAMRSPGNNRAR